MTSREGRMQTRRMASWSASRVAVSMSPVIATTGGKTFHFSAPCNRVLRKNKSHARTVEEMKRLLHGAGAVIGRRSKSMRETTSGMPRSNVRGLACGLVALLLLTAGLSNDRAPSARAQSKPAQKQPNIVWLVLDDASANLGVYGDPQAVTPNMDRLAREGARFTRAFANAPVCAPSRSSLVTGMYVTTTGAHHMRSKLVNPPETFMSLLRKTGYYVAWPGKGDINFDPAD